MSIGKKQVSKNSDWVEAWENCTTIIDEQHIREITNQAIMRIKIVEIGRAHV